MKLNVHISTVTAALAFAVAAMMIAAEIDKDPLECLAVHEWGTFTSVAGEDGSAIDWNVLGGKDDLPNFVKYERYRCFKFRLTGTVRMETPVLYFYSKRQITAHVTVAFPHGVVTEWYPKGDTAIYESKSLIDMMHSHLDGAVYQTKTLFDPPPPGLDFLVVKLSPSLNGFDTSLRNLMSTITWNDVKVQPDTTPDLPTEDRPSRYYAARATDADPITVDDEHEKFLFYRGVGRMAVPLSARISPDGKIVLAQNGSDSVPMVMLFENQAGRLGYSAGYTMHGSMTLDRPSLNGNRTGLADQLEKALVAQGLFWKEAHAMVTTWQDSWFEEGSRLIYIVPSHVVDSFLPLRVDPAPAQTTRVFVGRIELITPELKRSVQEAISNNDVAAGNRYGRFMEPILDRSEHENPNSAREVNRFREEVSLAMASGPCR
jgi:hypothetical protein